MKPLVTVITPCFNAVSNIKNVVDVVAKQNYNVEHLLINDGSKDDSLQIMHSFSVLYPHIKVIDLKENCGPYAARLEGIRQASGKYIAFLDVDDIWFDTKLDVQVGFMEATSSYATYSDYVIKINRSPTIENVFIVPKKITYIKNLFTRYIGCLTVVVRSDIIKNYAFPAVERDIRGEDYLMWSLLLKNFGPFVKCPGLLAIYNVNPVSRSSCLYNNFKCVYKIYRSYLHLNLFSAVLAQSVFFAFSVYKRIFFFR